MFAHSKNRKGKRHRLEDHLRNVGQLARGFASRWSDGEIAYWLGLWHDLGKFHPEFQAYLEACEKSPEARLRGPDHSSAGAVLAMKYWEGMSFPLAGHHGGLSDFTDIKERLRRKAADPKVQESVHRAEGALPGLLPVRTDILVSTLPNYTSSALSCEFFLRMLFSALVDADCLDTETHFEPQKSASRMNSGDLNPLWVRFISHQLGLTGQINDNLNRARHEIYTACLDKAEENQGVFRLTVPTGGGKTLSGMGFALKHAIHHKLGRVIVAIPYTSIIEQTVDIYRGIFGDEAVLEHHSAMEMKDPPEGPSEGELWSQLATENWDAPVIVTTTIQIFESIFANRTSRCRKLHNIAGSVIILDEVQTLPVELLVPILDVLQDLVDHYGVTLVLCTATQPALDNSPYLAGLRDVTEIIPDPSRYFRILTRVQYELPMNHEKWTWDRVATEMRSTPRCMTVVNTKKDAHALLDALDDPDALYLSTSLCGLHRRWVLNEVFRRLKAKVECRLVATQVVEAGVNLDFPVVLRALGPLDRIVQVAGRCNREGRLEDDCGNLIPGRVVIFDPVEGGSPRGAYRSGMEEACGLLRDKSVDMQDPALYERYFRRLYQDVETDAKGIQGLRQALRFNQVAAEFRMIPEETVAVVVRLPVDMTDNPGIVDEFLARVRRNGISREMFRRLQPFIVSIYARERHRLGQSGYLVEICHGLYEWLGGYHRVYGLSEGPRNPDELIW